jgi:long-chain fatty acid transport protein
MPSARSTTSTSLLVLTSVAAALPSAAQAAGYALKEQSSDAQANAFAGATAAAQDVSYMFFNPAALSRVDGAEANATLSYIMPKAEFKDGAATTVLGTPIPGTANAGDIGEDALVPAAYVASALAPGLTFGLGVNVPFGLTTENEQGWIGRYHALDSTLETININPALSFEAGDWLAVGFGLQIQRVDTRLTNAIDFGTIGAAAGIPTAVPTQQDGQITLKADDWGVGFNLGALISPTASTRFGIAYRSEIDHEAKGDADFRLDDAGTGATLSAVTGAFVDTGVLAEVTTPATLSLGAYHELTPQFALMAELAWTEWSEFDELRIQFDNPAQADNVTEENWEDTFFVALGATWRPLPNLALRGGVAYDESPVPDEFRTPRLPDADRYWLSGGVNFDPVPWLGLSASYTHIIMDDGDLDLTVAGTDNTFRGNLSGTYENEIDIVTVGATLRF